MLFCCLLFGRIVLVFHPFGIGHSACETLVSLFMGFSFGVWCVFNLVLLLFLVGCCSVCSLFGCIVLVVHPFCIAYWSVSMGTFDVFVFGVFIWCIHLVFGEFSILFCCIFFLSLVIVQFVHCLDVLF